MNQSKRNIEFESPESSSPITTRAVAGALLDQYVDSYPIQNWQRQALHLISGLPQSAAQYLISRFEAFSGLNPQLCKSLTTDQITSTRLKDYAALTGRYPCITIGAALGGASAHLALALGGPFLPQAFVLTLKGGSLNGDPHIYFQRSHQLALDITQKNPELLSIQHYDPVHDEWMTRRVNHLRLKLIDLPQSYRSFIHKYLQPGGAICYLDCRASWLRYKVGDRNIFQVGGWGDISAQEYLDGSLRLDQFARSVGMVHTQWALDGYPLENGAESEWGSEPGLLEAIMQYCAENGYRFIRISHPHPHDFSSLAFKAYEQLLNRADRKPPGVFINMFSQFDATAVMQSGLLPLWLIFNTNDSLEFLREMRSLFPLEKPVFFSPLATFTNTPDLAPYSAWEAVLDGTDWMNIGARASHFPADPLAIIQWSKPLREWVAQHKNPIQSHLTPEDLSTLLSG